MLEPEEFKYDDCQWASWGTWSPCEDDCGTRDGRGNQTRMREIAVEEANEGIPCYPSDASEQRSCGFECPGKNIKGSFFAP